MSPICSLVSDSFDDTDGGAQPDDESQTLLERLMDYGAFCLLTEPLSMGLR